MPAKSKRKLSPAQRAAETAEENAGIRILAKKQLDNFPEKSVKSSNGTIINGGYMFKPDGTVYARTIVAITRRKKVMKWKDVSK